MTEQHMEYSEGNEPKSGILVWAIIAIIIVILVIAGIRIFLPKKLAKPETINYDGFVFTKEFGSWSTQWQKGKNLYDITLHYNPHEVENITVSGKLNSTFSQPPLYITFEPREDNLQYTALAVSELSLNLARGLDKQLVAACTINETEGCADRPIVSCADSDKAVIFLEVANETAILLDNNCLHIQGRGLELTRAVDRIIYQWFKIMQ